MNTVADMLVLGVDGGGSKTSVLIADQHGAILGRGLAGASNYQAIGMQAAQAALASAVAAALYSANIAYIVPQAVCLGLAGVGRPEDQVLFQRWACELWPQANITVVNDAELALAAGTPDGWGLALICGTGSIVVGRNQQGRLSRAGGWGYLFGDEGSGYALGIGALRAVAHAADGRGPQTLLTELVLAHLDVDVPTQIIARIYQGRPSNHEIAVIAGLVDRAAVAGDAVACALIERACVDLATAAVATAGSLGLEGSVPCALAGGLLINTELLQHGIVRAARAQGLALAPCTLVDDPARGAVQIARRSLFLQPQPVPAVS